MPVPGKFLDNLHSLDVENPPPAPTTLMKAQEIGTKIREGETMKYILMMTGTKTGVDTYRAWSQKDIQTHFAHLTALNKDLTESGEFVTTEGLAMPHQAKVVRAGTNATPITDGVFPEAKEFLLGYWIVDVESPERAYEGEFVTTEGLAMPHQAKVVRAGTNGTPITDGVFPEAKEFLHGP